MSLPTPDSLKNMEYSFQGQPFIDVPAKSSIKLSDMEYSFQGQPFVRNEVTIVVRDVETRFHIMVTKDVETRFLIWGVTAQAADGLSTVQATVHGTIISPDGANATYRGFEWGLIDGGPYPNQWKEMGSFAAGPFDHTIAGLLPGTTYYFRGLAAR
jgi:hypothetical protein